VAEKKTRIVGVVLAWLLAAGAATLIGVVAVGAIGSGIVASPQQPLSAEEVDQRLAAPPPSDVPPAGEPTRTTRPSSPPPSKKPATKSFTSRGGNVVVRCSPFELVQTVPAQGFELDDVDERSDGGARVRFESDALRVEMHLSCRDGEPVSSTKTEAEDDDDD